jgi:hypothetical protein
MKKILLFIIFLICCLEIVTSQTPAQNLNKYWYYRERLKKYFIASVLIDAPSTNLPAGRINKWWGGLSLFMGDQNSDLSYYIGMLATEYKLLQLYNIDYSSTRSELLYALKAMERLDYTAESYWGGSDTLNGFMIRGDVTRDTIIKYNPPFANMFGFVQNELDFTYKKDGVDIHTQKPYEMSKDNVWGILLNLALVRKLVDDNEISGKARDIADRLVDWMHCIDCSYVPYWGDLCINGCWLIKNAATGNHVADGWDVNEIPSLDPCVYMDGFSYGFAEAADWICRLNEGCQYPTDSYAGLVECYQNTHCCGHHYNNSIYEKDYFYFGVINNVLDNGRGTGRYRTLATVFSTDFNGGDWSTYYELVRQRGSETVPNEHLPLIWRLLHGEYDTQYQREIFQSEISYYEMLLNDCPSNGIYYNCIDNTSNGSQYWKLGCRLTDALTNEKKTNPWFSGHYPGIDYMMLHNLFWLCHLVPAFNSVSVYCSNQTFYSTPSNVSKVGTKDNPYYSSSRNNTDVTGNVSNSGGIVVYAGQKVTLKKGFSVAKGSVFKAYTGKILASYEPYYVLGNKVYPVYQKIAINPASISLPNVNFYVSP